MGFYYWKKQKNFSKRFLRVYDLWGKVEVFIFVHSYPESINLNLLKLLYSSKE